MARTFNRLERVLSLEAQQGYQNKAVVGGIRQFATFWVEKAREEAVDEADLALVEQVTQVLMDYGRLPGTEARATAIDSLMGKLRARQQRRQPAPTSAPAGVDTPTPDGETKGPGRKSPAVRPPRGRTGQVSATGSLPAAVEARSRAQPDPEGLLQPVHVLRGVGPKVASLLERLGATTIGDMLYLFPRRYDDYSLMKPINRLEYGEQVTVIGTIWETRARRARDQVMVQSIVADGTGQVQVTWFNQQWLAEKLPAGMQIVLSGKVEQFLGRPVFQNPEWEPLELEPLRTRRIVPVYPLTRSLTSNKMREMMKMVVDQWAEKMPDPLPDTVMRRRNFLDLPQAVQQIHFPDSQEKLHQARRRLTFDELFLLQLGMLSQRRDWQSEPGIPLLIDEAALSRFTESLPFQLTGAQQRVIAEIGQDLAGAVPMNRLLQGDVGAGKTVVAAAAMVLAVHNGYQAALMAPTEILAEQHFKGLSKMLAPLNVEMFLLTGSTPKEEVYAALADGRAHIVVGTHALIQEPVRFKKLALAVIDEQHRFGVDQRHALRDKGQQSVDGRHNPHLLVMSATPIPRTLALSMYGDLDLAILDEMPPGRQEIKTRWLRPSERERAYGFVRGQIEQGRQAYIICPLVEESDKIEAKAAVEEYARLQEHVFPTLKLGLLHGRMKAEEKEAVMRAFYEGETDILVATSVIEVGIDVPNSTVIVIEGANRFGLAQLHQFRGRVGRGEHQSYCLLISDSVAGEAEERLAALEETNDGFLLAEKDLELRGPGEFFGRRQSGLPELQLASLLDLKMLEVAREEALLVFAEDPLLEQEAHGLLREKVAQFWQGAADTS